MKLRKFNKFVCLIAAMSTMAACSGNTGTTTKSGAAAPKPVQLKFWGAYRLSPDRRRSSTTGTRKIRTFRWNTCGTSMMTPVI